MARGSFYTTEKLGPKQSLTPEGFLLCEEVAVARTGLMIYGPDETPIKPGPDGITKIFREPADVFRPETIASAQGKSVANDHPEEDVTPENWRDLTVGVMLNVRRGDGALDDLLIGDLLITTPEGIEAVRGGKVEVSLGYDANYEEVSPGVGKQSDIIINHVALVEQGRCGPRCAINDSKPNGKETKAMSTKDKLMDAMRRAFKAKDADELEKITDEVANEMAGGVGSTGTGEGDTHIHIHNGESKDESELPGTSSGRASFTDEDLQAHIDQNAAEHQEMRSEIEALKEQVRALMGHEAAEGGETMDEEEMAEAIKDEVPEEIAEKAAKANDSAYLADSFQDTVALAEILVPGIKVPTFDNAAKPGQTFKKICGLRKQALDEAYKSSATRLLIGDLLGGKPLNTKNMTCDAARTLFRSAAAMKRTQNMAPRANANDGAAAKPAAMSLAELNRRNADHWNKQ